MSEQHRRFPENLVTAVLYRAALPEIDDKDLTLVLGQAAQTSELFGEFRLHPQYGDSPQLDGTLSNLCLGGSIVRMGLTTHVRPTDHTLGTYGKKLYEDYTPDERLAINGIANSLRDLVSQRQT